MVGKAKGWSKADRERLDAILDMQNCLACAIDGIAGSPVEIHHAINPATGNRYEAEHRHTVGLCAYHHRGVRRNNGNRRMPTLEFEAKRFRARYGTDEELLVMQDSLVRMWESERRRQSSIRPGELVGLTRCLWREVVDRR